MNKTWRRVLAAASVLALATPWAANAALAELSWGGRFGSGSIIYDRGAADAVDAEGRGSFLDAIVSFHVEGMKLPYGSGGIVLEGTGGSILSRDIVTPCNFFQNCESSSMTFLLGRSHANDPLSYRLTLSLPFALDDLDLIPIREDGQVDTGGEGSSIGGIIRNEFNSPSGNFWAVGFGAGLTHRLLAIAAPVPEPETWALFALGGGLLVWARRRQAAGTGLPVVGTAAAAA